MLRLAQAASSEYGTEYGTPPNQRRTGVTKSKPGGNMDGELNIVQFYGGWSAVFRPKDDSLAEDIAWMMTRVVENGKYGGYGQDSLAEDGGKYKRTGLFDELVKLKQKLPDPMAIKNLYNCDCSSSTGAVVYHCGVKDIRLRNMWTGNEEEILMGTGKFIKLTDKLLLSIGTGLRKGDILLKPGHTAIAIDTDDHYSSVPYRIGNCHACNLREGPSVKDPVVAVLYKGDIVNVRYFTPDWSSVSTFGGKYGFVSGMYCKEPLPETVAKGDVWLRKTPGKKGDPIIVIQKGETAYLTGNTKDVSGRTWKECVYANHLGWASSLYV